MKVIPPLEITPARLTSTTAVETYSAYNATTTYAAGALVFDPITNAIYESLIDLNFENKLDNSPIWNAFSISEVLPAIDMYVSGVSYNAPPVAGQIFATNGKVSDTQVYGSLDSPYKRYIVRFEGGTTYTLLGVTYQKFDITKTYGLNEIVAGEDKYIYISSIASNKGHPIIPLKAWERVAPSNKLAMFNYISSTRTIAASPLVVALTPSKRIDAIDLSGLVNVKTVRIVMTSGGSTVYDQTISTVKRSVMNYYGWFFNPFVYKKSVAKFDLPPYVNGIVTVTFTSASGNVEVGSLIIGSQFYVGETQYNATRDYINYSTVTRDFDGSVSQLVQRPGIPKTHQTVTLDKANVQALSDMLLTLDATPAAWSGIDETTDGYFEPVHLVGIVKSAPIDISSPTFATCSLELEAISSN